MNRRGTALILSSLVAGLVLSACGTQEGLDVAAPGATEPAPTASAEPTTAPSPTTPSSPAASDPATPDPAASDPASSAPEAADFTVRGHGQEVILDRGDGSPVEVLYTLNPEGEASFAGETVRPGSTPDDLTVVLLARAEGMYDLRWLSVTDGGTAEVSYFPDRYQLPPTLASDARPVPVFSPDGRSVAWVVAQPDGSVSLQTIGWSDDGPGTQRQPADSPDDEANRADDNASFGLEGLPTDVYATGWTSTGDARSVVTLTRTDGSATYRANLERQADGALALLEVTTA